MEVAMRSQPRRFWLPLTVLFVISGCVEVPELPPSEYEAYTCECSCDADSGGDAVPISADADDGAETISSGAVDLGAGELDIEAGQLIALRFDSIGVPRGARISSATVQFVSSDDKSERTDVAIQAQASNFAAPFSAADSNLSDRDRTTASVQWEDIPAWIAGAAGDAQRTPDLASLVQELVDRDDWSAASPIVLFFEASTGDRDVASHEDDPSSAPMLTISWVGAVATRLPVCLEQPVEATRGDDPDVIAAVEADCSGRVATTFAGLVGEAGYVEDASAACSCRAVPTTPARESESAKWGFTFSGCSAGCEAELLAEDASNFDAAAFEACSAAEIDVCVRNGVEPCVLSDECLATVSATHSDGDTPVCLANVVTTGDGLGSMARLLFGQRSECRVEGTTELLLGNEEPKKDPAAYGTLELAGRPCPGDACPVGVRSSLSLDSVRFDVKFARDPEFKDLSVSSQSFSGAALVGNGDADPVSAGAIRAEGDGRRKSTFARALGANEEPVDLTVDWLTRTCAFDGALSSSVDGEGLDGTCAGDGTTVCVADAPDCDEVGGPCEFPADPTPFEAELTLAGTIVNLPPHADAGASSSVECTSSAGATVTLDGSASFDPDGDDVRSALWRAEGRLGSIVARSLEATDALALGTSQTYVLQVLDSFGQGDRAEVSFVVTDTTPPDVFCNAPATIVPPDGVDEDEPSALPVAFSATASDVCDDSVPAEVGSVSCFAIKRNGRRVEKPDCIVIAAGDTITVLDSAGVGTHIAWTATAEDDFGNVGSADCEVEVVRP
jgi:hypothetical protein